MPNPSLDRMTRSAVSRNQRESPRKFLRKPRGFPRIVARKGPASEPLPSALSVSSAVKLAPGVPERNLLTADFTDSTDGKGKPQELGLR